MSEVVEVDEEGPTLEFEVTAQRIAEYARAIDDPNPRYYRVGRDATGVVAPRAMAAAYIQEPVRLLWADAERMERLGIDRTWVVFGEVEYVYGVQAVPGDWITVSGRLSARQVKGDKEFLTFELEAARDDGEYVVRGMIRLVRR